MSELWHPARSTLEGNPQGLRLEDLNIDTIATSSRFRPTNEEPLVQPIVHSSTYIIPTVDDYLRILQEGGYIYGRLGNPTCEAVECAINALEGGAGTLVFSSGTGAISAALFAFLQTGDHVVANKPLFNGTQVILEEVLSKFGVEVSWVSSGCDIEEYRKQVKPNTKVLYGESPCNPNMTLLDLEEFGKLGASLGDHVVTMVDGTYGSPVCQQSPHDANLLLRGLKTIHLRMRRHSASALRIAQFLENHPKVKSVLYPGLPSHFQHELAKKQMTGFSGMLAVEVNGGIDGGKAFVENVHLANLGLSLGGMVTLVQHPASTTYAPTIKSDTEREEAGIKEGVVRISIGLEDPDDLIKDLGMALEKVPALG